MVRRVSAAFVIACCSIPITAGRAAAFDLKPKPPSACIGIAEQDSLGVYLINRVAAFTATTDSAFNADRIIFKLPIVPASQLSLVTQEAVCSKAAAAYASAVSGQGSGLSGRALVVKVGTSATAPYVVLDPFFAYDASHQSYVHIVLDSKFNVLSRFP
jgi:hypothetical protein